MRAQRHFQLSVLVGRTLWEGFVSATFSSVKRQADGRGGRARILVMDLDPPSRSRYRAAMRVAHLSCVAPPQVGGIRSVADAGS